ncbi:MAG: FtsW/RodA/SpoVE family cell cycle protein, partial [Nitrospirae bacterium]|nr:FtsW/RodA/SpoVE family cell cycle protein [Nitrospirota bacterium]
MKGVDKVLLISVAILLVVGLGMVYSASGVMALKKHGDTFYFFKKQLLWVVIGLFAMAAAMRIGVPTWNRLALPLLGVTGLLLVAVLIPGVGAEVNGSRRW